MFTTPDLQQRIPELRRHSRCWPLSNNFMRSDAGAAGLAMLSNVVQTVTDEWTVPTGEAYLCTIRLTKNVSLHSTASSAFVKTCFVTVVVLCDVGALLVSKATGVVWPPATIGLPLATCLRLDTLVMSSVDHDREEIVSET